MMGVNAAVIVDLVLIAVVVAAIAWVLPPFVKSSYRYWAAHSAPGDATVTAVSLATTANGEVATLSVRVVPCFKGLPYDSTLVLHDLAPDSPLRAYCARGAWVPVRTLSARIAPTAGGPAAVMLDLARAAPFDAFGRPKAARTTPPQRRSKRRARSASAPNTGTRTPPERPGAGPITFS